MRSLIEFMARRPKNEGWGRMKYRRFAPKLLPYLVWCAINKKLMTYGDLARNVELPTEYRQGSALQKSSSRLAGFIGEYCDEIKLPTLNALVVNKQSLLPSDGIEFFLTRYDINNYENLDAKEKRRELSNKLYPLIFQPGIWMELLKINKIEPLEPKFSTPYNAEKKRKTVKIKLPVSFAQNNSGESEEHKALKKYVADNCEKIESLRLLGCKKEKAEMEYMLPSADRPDIFFSAGDFSVACEIKSWRSDDNDLLRGLFQCVKYRALLNAQDTLEGRLEASECLLVVQKVLPEHLQRIANIFYIPVINLSRGKVGN